MLGTGTRTLLTTALWIGATAAGVKLLAAMSTASTAILAEGIHALCSATHLAILAMALAQSTRAGQAAVSLSPDHARLGFWCYVVAILVYALGAGIALYVGIERLPDAPEPGDPVAAALVLGGPLAANALVLRLLHRHASARSAGAAHPAADAAVETVIGIETAVAIAGLAAALVGYSAAYALGWTAADPLAAVAVGLLMGAVAARMALATRTALETASGASGAVCEIIIRHTPDATAAAAAAPSPDAGADSVAAGARVLEQGGLAATGPATGAGETTAAPRASAPAPSARSAQKRRKR